MKTTSFSVCAALVFLTSTASQSQASIATVSFDSGSYSLYNLNGSTVLTGGSPTIDGDGAVLQLGYFSGATSAQPFPTNGTWIALTGEGGANSAFANTTIGNSFDAGAGNGTFAMSLTFDTQVAGKNVSLPSANTPLGIRVYNNTSIATSTYYMTISSPLVTWQWVAPNTPPNNPSVNLSLDDSSLRLQNGTLVGAGVVGSNGFSTTLPTGIAPVPEPSTFLFGALAGLAGLLPRSRRTRFAKQTFSRRQ